MTIEGKIAKIIDERHVVINKGRAHGVRDGMRFGVFALGDVVTDPEGGTPLERWEISKGRIVVTHAQEKIAICVAEQTDLEKKTDRDPSTQTLSADMVYMSKRKEQQGIAESATLNVNRSQMDGMPEIGPISIGDLVRSLEGP